MIDLKRETLGAIWRLCDQMAYAAENGYTQTLKAQFSALRQQMRRLELVEDYIYPAVDGWIMGCPEHHDRRETCSPHQF